MDRLPWIGSTDAGRGLGRRRLGRRRTISDGDILETRDEWTRFLSALVHELRTPLGSLLMLADLLRDGDSARYAANIREAAEDIQALLGETGELTRLLAGRVPVRADTVELDALAQRLEESIRPLAWQRGISFTPEIDPGVPAALATDPDLLQRILSLLLESALAGAESALALRIGRHGDRVWFAASADGRPLDEASIARLFEPLADAGRSRRAHGGRGLALPLARELARLLGGELGALNRGGRPTFELTLPAA